MARTLSIVLIILLLILTGFLITFLIFNLGFFDSVKEKSFNKGLVLVESQGNTDRDVLFPISATKLSGSAFLDSSEEECGLGASCDGNNAPGRRRSNKDKDDDLECLSNSDCTADYYGNNYCLSGNIYKDLNDFFCKKNKCEKNLIREIVELCFLGCENGSCIKPECWTNEDCSEKQICDIGESYQCINVKCVKNSDCEDLNALTQDFCVNTGSVDSFCEHVPINCNFASDCGINEFVGDNYCSSGNAVRDYKTFSCIAPGTILSSCSSNILPQIVVDCTIAQTCEFGNCVNVKCFDDAGCNDGNSLTLDKCINPGQGNSYCENTSIKCSKDSDCDDSNPNTVDSCLNPGTLDSSCSNVLIACDDALDCGVNDFFGIRFCNLGNVFQNYKTWSCLNPGTSSSMCLSNSSPFMIDKCGSGTVCSSGSCVKDCVDNDSDSYDNCIVGESPDDDGKTKDCNDNNPNIYPSLPATFEFQGSWDFRNYLNPLTYSDIPDTGSVRWDDVSRKKVCELMGYNSFDTNLGDSKPYSSCSDNTVTYWDNFSNNFVTIPACTDNRPLGYLKCLNPVC